MASFPDWSSILPIFCPFCSPSRCFCHLSPVQRPVLHDFRSSDQNELFNNLVAQFVGIASAIVKANLLLTHFDNFKWTHPDCEKKESIALCGELATALTCSAMAAQSIPSEEHGIKVAPLS